MASAAWALDSLWPIFFLLLSQVVALQHLILRAWPQGCWAEAWPWLFRGLQLHVVGLLLWLLQSRQHRHWRLRQAVQQLLKPSGVASDWLRTPLEEAPRRETSIKRIYICIIFKAKMI